jgi:glycosyltransferase involved in cell wall biosynthesis
LRVSYIISSLLVGGAERLLVNTINAMPLEHEIQLILFKEPAPLLNSLTRSNVHLVRLGMFSYFSPITITKLLLALRRFAPDVIHTHMNSSNLILRFLSPFVSRSTALVNHYHGLSLWKPGLFIWLDRMTSPLATRVICCSRSSLERRMEVERIHADRLLLLHNAVDQGDSKLRVSKESGSFVIGTACRLNKNKRVWKLLEWHADLRNSGVEVSCFIAGTGPDFDELRDRALALGHAEHVHFLGHLEDMPAFYSRLDLFLLSSQQEDFPMVLIEALAAGCVTVSHDTGGAHDILDNAMGGAVLDLDGEEVHEHLWELLQSSQDSKLIMKNADHARHFSMSVYIPKLLKIYQEAINAKKSS